MVEWQCSWLPTRAAAEMLNVSRQRVYQLLKAGALVGMVVAGTWMISARSVDARIALLEKEAQIDARSR